MCEFEIWIDVICRGADCSGPICTLFATHEMPIRPNINETLSYYQEKGSHKEFVLIGPHGSTKERSVRVNVEDISHYAVKSDGKVIYKTSIRCSELVVASEHDARIVSEFMIEQCGFFIDPYGINRLSL